MEKIAREQAEPRTDTLVWGKNAVTELLKSGGAVDTVYLADSLPQPVAGYYTALAKQTGAVVKRVPGHKLQKICGTDDHQGVAACPRGELHAVRQSGEEGIGGVRHHHAEGLRRSEAEGACRRVGAVPQHRDGLPHPRLGLRRHPLGAVYHVADDRRADPREPGHIIPGGRGLCGGGGGHARNASRVLRAVRHVLWLLMRGGVAEVGDAESGPSLKR